MLLALILAGAMGADWLLDPSAYVSKARVSAEEVSLDNGLVRRTIRLAPSPVTVSFKNLLTGEELLRGVSPEARIVVGGTEYKVGGLEGQPIYNYLRTDWLDGMKPPKDVYKYAGSSEGAIEARFPCRLRREWMGRDLPWPPKGRHVRMHYLPPKPGLPEVDVHYEIYDGLPLVCKWLTVENRTSAAVELDDFTVDEIRYAESGQMFDTEDGYLIRNFHILSDLTLQDTGSSPATIAGYSLCKEPDYTTQMCYSSVDPWTLKVKLPTPPHLRIDPGSSVTSHRGWFLAFDSTERERRGLAVRRAYRTLAPWTDENPLMFHLKTRTSPDSVREGIRQCAETGFEALIMSFGSGFNLESTDSAYRRQYHDLSAEAKAKGVALGGYSLTSSRNAGNRADNVQNPKPRFGRGPCLGAKWGMDYLKNLKSFMADADFGIFENDGPYPGDTCSATNHPGHRGFADSLWVQWQAQSDLYKFCRARGIYVNQPDSYFLNGGNKTGMGYKERNWSLPREYQPVIERQNIFDGSWLKSTSMGWMFVPLAQYHGGGAAATVEPLERNLAHYDLRFADNLGAGVQACWRGPRLFDTEKTLAVVRKWTSFYKSHRRVLTGDLIHLRRPDGRDWDGWVKVDPQADERAMAFLFNPTTVPIEREIRLPLYYAGLKDRASLSVGGAKPVEVSLDRECRATVKVEIPAEGYVWMLAKVMELK